MDIRKARVLTHELAHVVMGHVKNYGGPFHEPSNGEPPPSSPGSPELCEVEAETTACLVCAAHGIDVSTDSRPYLMQYWEKGMHVHMISHNVFQAVRSILRDIRDIRDARSFEPPVCPTSARN